MDRNTVISISGAPGSGTTTIAELLSRKLQLRVVYTGDIFRELANEYNMGLTEFGKYVEENLDIDQLLDDRQVEYARSGNVILEGRLAGWLMKTNNIVAFKVLLTAELDIRISRIMGREQKSYDLVKSEILERERCELDRYNKLYNANYHDESIYDIIIETSNLTPDQIVDKILDGLTETNL